MNFLAKVDLLMSQKLGLPIINCRLNASYKSTKYKKEWGWNHWGVDLGEVTKTDRTLYSPGDGKV
ncbi:MAG: hypothetical protein RR743_07515, partial [Oscillospiraceae bacterium]